MDLAATRRFNSDVETLVAPLFSTYALLIDDEPLLVFAAAEAVTTTGEVVRLKRKTMRALADQLGFPVVDRWPTRQISDAVLACRATGVTLEVRGKAVDVLEVARPSTEWLEAASERRNVAVVFAVRVSRLLSWARNVLHISQGSGGLVDAVVSPTKPSLDRYVFVGSQARDVARPLAQSIVLDSCVLIDLERAASGQASASEIAHAHHLVLEIIHSDVLPGSAINELVISAADGTTNRKIAQTLNSAVNAWFDGGASRAKSVEAVQRAYRLELQKRHPELPADQSNFVQTAFYASVLKLMLLWSEVDPHHFRAKQRVELFAEFSRWMTDELGLVCAYPLQVGRDRLIGPQGSAVSYVDQLLRGKCPSRANAWSASWDLTHLWSIDLLQPGNIIDIDGRDVVLVTADRGIVGLRDHLKALPAVLELPYGDTPFILLKADLDKRLSDLAPQVQAIHDRTLNSVRHRNLEHRPLPTDLHLAQTCRALETQLDKLPGGGVQQRTKGGAG